MRLGFPVTVSDLFFCGEGAANEGGGRVFAGGFGGDGVRRPGDDDENESNPSKPDVEGCKRDEEVELKLLSNPDTGGVEELENAENSSSKESKPRA